MIHPWGLLWLLGVGDGDLGLGCPAGVPIFDILSAGVAMVPVVVVFNWV